MALKQMPSILPVPISQSRSYVVEQCGSCGAFRMIGQFGVVSDISPTTLDAP
jgi:hypothetical protein